ncbi:MAG: prepilin-type N-terminal cleavage/methylation domain-containing protein [Polyangiaceae bacterium]|nr:prepilin-type N-terminal cleavage/methylation domain-containing protein [Polyangiaceae bacterium]
MKPTHLTQRSFSRARRRERGLTLIEVMVSLGIIALIATLIYGALDGMSKSREGLSRIGDRYHQGRTALSRITRELQSAFVSAHVPVNLALITRSTIFLGKDSGSEDRIDFTAFAHQRLARNAHESDQCELSYFMTRDPNVAGKVDLVRREDPHIDQDPEKGGVVLVVAEDVAEFDLRFYDPLTQLWTDSWDSSQATGQLGRLPGQVKVSIVLNGGPGDKPIRFQTKVPIQMQLPLTFAIPR